VLECGQRFLEQNNFRVERLNFPPGQTHRNQNSLSSILFPVVPLWEQEENFNAFALINRSRIFGKAGNVLNAEPILVPLGREIVRGLLSSFLGGSRRRY
jgi:hypothetical protein